MTTTADWNRVHRLYDQLRLKYFMCAEDPLIVPPPASQLRWYWLAPSSLSHAETAFDADHEVYELGLNVDLRRSRSQLVGALLHELTHIRIYLKAPGQVCGHRPGSPARNVTWRNETIRLAVLGAPLL